MTRRIKTLATASVLIALSTALPGCGKPSEPKSANSHSAGDGHDHAGDGRPGHDQVKGDHGQHDDHDHAKMRTLGPIEIAGTTLAVSISEAVQASTQVQVEFEVKSGPAPAAIRFWVGDQAGTGAAKSKADAHDGHFHGETETPADLGGARLWIELESTAGSKAVGSLDLR